MKKALAQRQELTAELKTARRAKADANRERTEAETAIKALEHERDISLRDSARGRADAEQRATEIPAELSAATARRDEAAARANAAESAGELIEKEIRQLYAHHAPVFMREAEEATQAAMKAREVAATAIEESMRLDAEAGKKWDPIRDAVRTVATDGQRTFGGKSGMDLGAKPRSPKAVKEALTWLHNGPAPRPVHVSEPSRFAALLPTAVRSLLGVSVPKITEKPVAAEPTQTVEVIS